MWTRPTKRRRKAYEKTEAIQFLENRLQEENNQYRIINENKTTLPANIGNVIPNFFTTDSQRATLGIEYYEYLCRDWSFSSDNFKFLGTKYLLSKEKKVIDGFELIFTDNIYYIYEREAPISIFWEVLDNEEKVSCPEIDNIEWKTNSVEINGKFLEGTFVFAQQNYPGWKVFIDGEKQEISTYDIFMGANVVEGSHVIKFVYDPIWKYVMFITVAIVLILTVFSFADVIKVKASGEKDIEDNTGTV